MAAGCAVSTSQTPVLARRAMQDSRLATGTFIAFLDSDDRWHDGRLALQLALFAARPDVEPSTATS